jgi:hypothetical protein
MMFNFNWSYSSIHNFFLKNKMSSIDLNSLSNISSYDFLFSCKTFLISIHVWSFWLTVLTGSNKDNFEFEFSSIWFFFVSFNSCTIREFIFFVNKTIWCMYLFRSSDSSSDRFSDRFVSESTLSFFFFNWYAIVKLNSAKNSIYLACRRFNYLVIIKYFKLLWSVSTLINIFIDCNFVRHCSKHLKIVNNSLS